jgi:hypothetical protein
VKIGCQRSKRRTPKEIRKISRENKEIKTKIIQQIQEWELEDKKQQQQYSYLWLGSSIKLYIKLFNTDTPVKEFVCENKYFPKFEFAGAYAVTENSCYFVELSAKMSQKGHCINGKRSHSYPFLEICLPLNLERFL